jgi:hypothetical protein
MNMKRLLKLAFFTALALRGAASGGELRACFTPGKTALLVEQINAANRSC